jgi:hypothetical protein
MSEDSTKPKNIRDFISNLKIQLRDGNPVSLLDFAYAKCKATKRDENTEIDTCSKWLILEVKSQVDRDGKAVLAEGSVNSALSKPEPSGRIIEAARKLNLLWLEDFFTNKKQNIGRAKAIEMKDEYAKIINQFYDDLKVSPEGVEVSAEAWKDLEASIEKAHDIVVCHPELRGVKSFLEDILKSYAKILKNIDGDYTRVPRLFVVHMKDAFLRRPKTQTEDFFQDLYSFLYDLLDVEGRNRLPQLIYEKVIMVAMPSALCIRPEVFFDPNDPVERMCSGYSFFIEPGDGWSPIRLEREVTKLWIKFVGERIDYSQDPPSNNSLQDQGNALLTQTETKDNKSRNHFFSETKIGLRLLESTVIQSKPNPQDSNVASTTPNAVETAHTPPVRPMHHV